MKQQILSENNDHSLYAAWVSQKRIRGNINTAEEKWGFARNSEKRQQRGKVSNIGGGFPVPDTILSDPEGVR